MRLTESLLLATALTVQSTTASITPVCGGDYSGSAGNAYTISCGQTYSGSTVQSTTSKLRRSEWSLGRRAINEIRATQASTFADCISTCDATTSCIAVSYLSNQCTLLASVTGITEANGAQAAMLSAEAATVLPSIGAAVAKQVLASVTATLALPNATTTTLSPQSQIAQHISAQLADNAPIITGADTQVYLTATNVPTATLDGTTSVSVKDLGKRATSLGYTCVPSKTSVVKSHNPTTYRSWCSSWNANKPHSLSPYSTDGLLLPTAVSNACSCILADSAATTVYPVGYTCVPTKTAVVKSHNPSSYRSWCSSWNANKPHSLSPYSTDGLLLPTAVSNACSCILADSAATTAYPVATAKSSSKASATSSAINSATTGAYTENTGKRGLAYNDATLTEPFSRAGQNSRVSWAYNWGSSETSSSFNSALEYIPMLWSNATSLTSVWAANAQTAINNGATALMSFNEPDWCYDGASCMTVASAVTAYKKYIMPFKGQALIGAPAVTNAGAPYGLTWLQEFMDACTDCHFDFIVLHWYSNKYAGATYFEEYVNSARTVANGLPIWITEFGLDSTYSYTDAELQSFLETVMPWMDQQSDIDRYSYFMDAAGYLIQSDGSGLSGTGAIYNSFVNSTTQSNLY